MSVKRFFTEPILTIEDMGEVNGSKVNRTTSHLSVYVELTEAQRRGADGAVSASRALLMLPADGFGDTWSLKPGDKCEVRDENRRVVSVTEAQNPRLRVTSHIEATLE